MLELSATGRRRAEALACLKAEVARLERSYTETPSRSVRFGTALDDAFDEGALPLGCIHELLIEGRDQEAASQGFISALMSKMSANGGIVWITKLRTIFPPGLTAFGLAPDRICFLDLSREKDALWAAEEALRCKTITAVVAEIANIDLTASRRLQLAAEHSGAPVFLMRLNPNRQGATASATRWRIKPLPSTAPDGLPGVGFPAFDVELLKVRGGRPGQWQMEWRGKAFHDVQMREVSQTPATTLRAGAA